MRKEIGLGEGCGGSRMGKGMVSGRVVEGVGWGKGWYQERVVEE